MHNLSMVTTYLIVTYHGSYTLWHGACARVPALELVSAVAGMPGRDAMDKARG